MSSVAESDWTIEPEDIPDLEPFGPRLADLEHRDPPDDEDMIELETRTFAHIRELIADRQSRTVAFRSEVGYGTWCEHDEPDELDEPEDLDDDVFDDGFPDSADDEPSAESSGPMRSPPEDRPSTAPEAAPGPLAGPLSALVFRLEAPDARPSKGRRGVRMMSPSDIPGWRA